MGRFFGSDLHVVNIGVSEFAHAISSEGGAVRVVDWSPMQRWWTMD